MIRRLVVVCALAASVSFAQTDPWGSLMVQADHQDRAGNYSQAEKLYREAARIVEHSRDSRYAQSLDGLANTANAQGRFHEAERIYLRALALLKAAGDAGSSNYAVVSVNLGMHYVDLGKPAKGEKLIREALEIFRGVVPQDNLRIAQSLNAMAVALMATDRYRLAEEPLQKAIAVFQRHPEPGSARLVVALSNLGAVRRYQERYEESAQLFRESVAEADRELGADHPMLIRTLNNLALVEDMAGHRDAAEAAFRRALAVAERRRLTAHPIYGTVLQHYADLARKSGNKREAKSLEARAKAVFADNARTNGDGMTVDAASFRSPR